VEKLELLIRSRVNDKEIQVLEVTKKFEDLYENGDETNARIIVKAVLHEMNMGRESLKTRSLIIKGIYEEEEFNIYLVKELRSFQRY